MDMDIYKSGAEVNVNQAFVNYDGDQIYPTSISYRVEDEDGVEIVADTAHTFDPDDTEMSIVIAGADNTLDIEDWTKMRVVIITLVADGHDYEHVQRYIVRQGSRLAEWVNSFQTYNSALMRAFDITQTPGWDIADEDTRQTALIEAYENIGKIKFNGDAFYGDSDSQSYDTGLNVYSEGFYIGGLADTEINNLSEAFVEALKRAQILEADYLLGSETVEDKRRGGLMSETVGESSNMFRPGKPIVLPVSNRAMKALAGYILLGRRVGRG